MAEQAGPRLALGGLLVFTLLTFSLVLADGPYPGPALVGLLLSGALAVAAGRLGLRPAAVLLLSGGALLWYLAIIFASKATFYGLPTLHALRSLGTSIERAYRHSQVDFAPVPVRPGYVVLIVTAMWVSATWGEVATSRWRAPWAALVPPIGLFALVLIVGTRAAAPLLVVGFITLALTYLALASRISMRAWGRVPRAPKAERDVVTPLARRMAAASVAAAFIAPPLLPAVGSGMVAWRNAGSGGGVGGSGGIGTGFVNPLVQIAPTLVNQTDHILFRVTTDRPAYWRLVTLTEFDGETWRPDPQARVAVGGERITILHGGEVEPEGSLNHQVEIADLRGGYLPAAASPLFVRDLGERQDDLRQHPLTGDLALAGGVEAGLTYSVQSLIPELTRSELLSARPGTITEGGYAEAPPLDPAVVALRDEWTRGLKRPGAKLIAIQDRLRGFGYHVPDTVEELAAQQGGASVDYLTTFLTEIRTGYCQQFATAFALLARSLGYPARVSVGFLPGSADDPGLYNVRGTDAHAWPEVYFERHGWVPFEPTPRGEAAAPRYTLSRLIVPGNFQAPDAAIFGPGLRAGNLGADPDLAGAGGTRRGRLGANGADDRRSGRSVADRWARAFAAFVTRTLVVLLAALALVPAAKAWRLRRRYRRAADPRAMAAAAFAHFEDEARDLVGPRGAAESAPRYAARLASAKRVAAGPAARLAALHDAAQFAAEAPGTLQTAEARRIARHLARDMWTRAGWRARAVRLFSPRWLLRGS